ncbi:Spy/CpxP family protein refolding chaperone [Neisseria arctica]|uniref:Spy/CpxP family protein refolding chaperone n=1 Tax=Neisseria arctica TaxID=1470200 RepID=UPI001F1D4F32|nr:Spy/CpxP family protein refolding chaperone [Neisseria arctica]UOO87438.1 Spy/CpxP family protein refolding chaperone [Neisseria arctica]
MLHFHPLRPLVIKTTLFGALFSSASLLSATPLSAPLDDFQPNCDIRQLSLTPEQRNQLRTIRYDYKRELDQANSKNNRISRFRHPTLMRLLSAESFNENAARDYIQARYMPSMDFAIGELKIQHRFYQLLTPMQRQQWLKACLK